MTLRGLFIIIVILLSILVFLFLFLKQALFIEVERTSLNILKVKKLREKYNFRRIIYPFRTIHCSAKNYSCYKKTQYLAVLEKDIKYNSDNLRLDLSSSDYNRKLYDKYLSECRDAYSPTPSFIISQCGLPEKIYNSIEKRLLKKYLIKKNVYEISVKVIVSYTSPKGKTHVSKNKVFSYDSIIGQYHKWEKRQNLETRIRRERAKITPDMRYNILARDGFRCRLCGLSAEEGAILEVDHIIPVSKGGLSVSDNLQTLCRDCNAGKSDKFPNEILERKNSLQIKK